MKQIFREYITAFQRINWGAYAQRKAGMIGGLTAACISMIRDAVNEETGEGVKTPALLLLFVIAIGGSLFLTTTHPIWREKQFYLLPMSEEERRTHIRRSYWFGFGVKALLAAVCAALITMLTFTGYTWINGLLLFANLLMLAPFISVETKAQQKKVDYESVIRWVLCIFVLVNAALLVMAIGAQPKKDAFLMLDSTSAVLLLLIQLPLAIAYRKSVKLALEAAVYYEEGGMA